MDALKFLTSPKSPGLSASDFLMGHGRPPDYSQYPEAGVRPSKQEFLSEVMKPGPPVKTPFGSAMEYLGITRERLVESVEKPWTTSYPHPVPEWVPKQEKSGLIEKMAEMGAGLLPYEITPQEAAIATTFGGPRGKGKPEGKLTNPWQMTVDDYVAAKEKVSGKLTDFERNILRKEHSDLVKKAQEKGLVEPPKPPVEPGKGGGAPRPTIEELSALPEGRGWIEFESAKGIVRGKINDINPYDKTMWVFPADRSLLPDPKNRQVLQVPFNKVTKVIPPKDPG